MNYIDYRGNIPQQPTQDPTVPHDNGMGNPY